MLTIVVWSAIDHRLASVLYQLRHVVGLLFNLSGSMLSGFGRCVGSVMSGCRLSGRRVAMAVTLIGCVRSLLKFCLAQVVQFR